MQKGLERKNGDIVAECCMILENIPKNFKEKFRMHAGLPDYGNTAIGNSLCGRCKKKICDFES